MGIAPIGYGGSAESDWTEWPSDIVTTGLRIAAAFITVPWSGWCISTMGNTAASAMASLPSVFGVLGLIPAIPSLLVSLAGLWVGVAATEWLATGKPKYSLKFAASVGNGLWWGTQKVGSAIFGRSRAPA